MPSRSAQDILANLERQLEELRQQRQGRRVLRAARQAEQYQPPTTNDVLVPSIPGVVPPLPALPEANKRGLDFGSFPGSGVLENVASGGLDALQTFAEKAQSLNEVSGGALTHIGTMLMPGQQQFERNLKQVINESDPIKGVSLAKRGSAVAEAFRRTDFPTLDLPGKGIDLMPGKGEFKVFDTLGVKGALELTPDALIAGITGGGSLIGSGAASGLKGGARVAGSIAAETVGLDLAIRAGQTGFRLTRGELAGLRGARKAFEGKTGLIREYTSDDEIIRRATGQTGTPAFAVGPEGAETTQQALLYTETGVHGPLGTIRERIEGFQSVADVSDPLDRALLVFATKEQESISKVAQASNLIRNRGRDLFKFDEEGIKNVGVHPGQQVRVDAVGVAPGTKPPISTAEPRRVQTAGEPIAGAADLTALSDAELISLYEQVLRQGDGQFNARQRTSILEEIKKRRVEAGGSTTKRRYPKGKDGKRIRTEKTYTFGGKQVEEDPLSSLGPFRGRSVQASQVFEDAFDVPTGGGTIDSLRKLTGQEHQNALNLRKSLGEDLPADTTFLKNDKWGYVFTREQAEYIQFVHNIIEDTRGLMTKGGVKVGDTILEGIGSNWTPRRVIGGLIKEPSRIYRGRQAIGRAESHAKPRSYVGQTIEEGIKAGLVYENDIANVMEGYLTGVYRAIREQQLANEANVFAIKQKAAARRAGVPLETLTTIDAGGVTPPAFSGKFFTKDVAKKIEKFVKPIGPVGKAVGDIGDVLRTARASSDFSAPFIQGLLLLARNPVKWGEGAAKMFRAFLDDNYYQKWFDGNINDILRATDDQVVIAGRNEFFAGLEPIQRGLRKIPLAGSPSASLFNRFERSFNFFGDYARLEMYKALEETARKAGPDGMKQLADFVNKSTGTFRPGASIIPPSQQAIERMFIFFAPRYTRAALSLVKDALVSGGISGSAARESLMRLSAGGLATYALAAQALGQKPIFDPSDPKFLRLKVGGDYIGIGTIWRSLVRLAADIATDPAFEGRVEDSRLLFQSGRFGEQDLSTRVQDNPIISWFRSRTSIISGNAVDIFVNHSDFVGNPIEGPIDIAKHLQSQSLPFIVEDAFLSKPRRTGAIGLTASLLGLSSFPQSLSTRRNIMQDRLAVEAEGVLWKDLNKLQQQRILANNFELQQLTEEAQKDRVHRGTDLDRSIQEWFTAVDEINETYATRIQSAYYEVLGNPEKYDLVTFRRVALADFAAKRRAEIDGLFSSPRYAKVQEWFEDTQRDKAPGSSPERPEDVAYMLYLDQVAFNPDFDLPTGEYDYDARRSAEQAFEAQWGKEVVDYAKTRLNEGREVLPIVDELYKGRDRFAFYWGNADDPNTAVGAVLAQRRDPVLATEIYKQYIHASVGVAEEMRRTNGELRRILADIDKVRAALRRRDPELDVFLVRWGYTSVLLHPENHFAGAAAIARDPQARPYVGDQPSFLISGARQQIDSAAS